MGGKTRNIAIQLVLQQTPGVVLSYVSHILVCATPRSMVFVSFRSENGYRLRTCWSVGNYERVLTFLLFQFQMNVRKKDNMRIRNGFYVGVLI